jgi:hypothetical protein
VLNFFETVGLLVRRHAINEEMAWHTFGYWVDCYGGASATVVQEVRRKHPDEFEDFVALRRRLAAREAARGNPKGKCTEPPHNFLMDESRLR